jgi:hypothetical protein
LNGGGGGYLVFLESFCCLGTDSFVILDWSERRTTVSIVFIGNLRRTPLTNSCVWGCMRIRFGEYGRI